MNYALIIEDDPDAADVAGGMLQALGYETDVARDGHGALYSLSDKAPDLILLDICLPQMDGVTLMKVAPMLVERASESFLAVRTGEDVLALGEEVRATIKVRRAVNDAMQDFDIRIMGLVEDRRQSPRGVRYRIKPRFCNPTDGLKLIVEELARPGGLLLERLDVRDHRRDLRVAEHRAPGSHQRRLADGGAALFDGLRQQRVVAAVEEARRGKVRSLRVQSRSGDAVALPGVTVTGHAVGVVDGRTFVIGEGVCRSDCHKSQGQRSNKKSNNTEQLDLHDSAGRRGEAGYTR
ncbi:MAG: response regulator [Proteobacteria bacterium]|nr:response regulator [Pseudomonadota bacterium]